MRRVDLELLVQRVVGNLQAGRPIEDDRVELKSDWPGQERARQLAGAANALRGEFLVYIIGCREDGTIHPVSDVDPETWHASIDAAFDSDAPQLVIHANVSVGDAPEDTVVALLFETDRFPYVMMVKDKTDRREVPLRVASRTVSANRQQLLRVLAPKLLTPSCQITEVEVTSHLSEYAGAQAHGETEPGPGRAEISLHLRARVFIEYSGTTSATIPVRSLRARLSFTDMEPWSLSPIVNQLGPGLPGIHGGAQPEPAPPRFGVYAKGGFIVATGPGEFSFRCWSQKTSSLENQQELTDMTSQMDAADGGLFELRFSFVGVDASTGLEAPIRPKDDPRGSPTGFGPDKWFSAWAMEPPSYTEDW